MSPLSRHHRYFGSLAEPDLGWLDHMTDSDVAVVGVDAERIVGLGRCVTVAPQLAELAFEVGDEDQHRGIGTLLLEYMARIARTRCIAAFRADVESDNKDMLDVFEHCGFMLRANADRDGYHVVFSMTRRNATHAPWPSVRESPYSLRTNTTDCCTRVRTQS